jgi:TPR repeat protein
MYSRDCDRGNAWSCYELGIIYQSGRGGKKDIARAILNFKQACDLGEKDACSILDGLIGTNARAYANHRPTISLAKMWTSTRSSIAGSFGSVTTLIETWVGDEDGDPLTYDWTATSGTIEGNLNTAIWRRESRDGKLVPGAAILVVRDGQGGLAIEKIDSKSRPALP